jgi:hypothetical protein
VNYVLTAFPQRATAEDYAGASDELEHALSEIPGALAVYRYGGITTLGVSDIDRLVVVDGRPIPPVWPQLSDWTRYLAMHTPAVVDAETFVQHRWFAELGSPELVWGTAFPIEPRPVVEYSEPLLAAEALTVTALKLAKLAVTGRAKVRPWLCELGNMQVDLRLARLSQDDAPKAWSLVDEVRLLREDWWRLEDHERRAGIRRLLVSARGAVHQALESLVAPMGGDSRDRHLRLDVPWGNVTLTPSATRENTAAWISEIVGRSRRVGEARWRWLPRRLRLPPEVITLLVGPPPEEYAGFRATRDALLRRQRDLVAAFPGYSGLKLGPTLAT